MTLQKRKKIMSFLSRTFIVADQIAWEPNNQQQ